MKLQHILFDLDGTLTDPKIGITRSIQYALEKLKKPVPSCDNLTWCIGPPLLDSLHRLVGGEDLSLAREALALYRERFSELGKFENTVYPDIPELLKNLQQQGFQLFLATAKPDLFAREILDHFQLSSYFSNIYGSKLNGELSKKGDLIQHIIQRERLQAEHALMVGDRKHDVLRAKSCGMKSLGLLYGYGTHQELIEAGADFLADNPLDILSVLEKLQRHL